MVNVKVGDLIKRSRDGILATVSRGPYTHRFMESQDYEMEAHGMGEYAGVYGSAYDITYTTGQWAGRTMRIQSGKGGWACVSDSEVSVESG
jgi:hypothetical protein